MTTELCCVAAAGGDCFQAVIDDAFLFSYDDTVMLPLVGGVFNGGVIDQTFHDTTAIHEGWHRSYISALLSSTYVALETWSSTYKSNKVNSAAAALALGTADLTDALTAAAAAFAADFSTDVTNPVFGHQNAIAFLQNIGGVDTWRSQNPDWGAAAVAHANGINVNFAKGAGTCDCVPIPEPGTGLMMAIGLIGFAIAPRRFSKPAFSAGRARRRATRGAG
ncbi:MAG: PEP-CTERM sorting domain-containing protein [Myxococcales bacterium]|nr:PEP-CTERM sorting domain-containing protein [Myxococcales bacterium]